jgi:hypothetical protein
MRWAASAISPIKSWIRRPIMSSRSRATKERCDRMSSVSRPSRKPNGFKDIKVSRHEASIIQFERETPRSTSPCSFSLQTTARMAGRSRSWDNSVKKRWRKNDRHDPSPRELFHEQIPQIGFYREHGFARQARDQNEELGSRFQMPVTSMNLAGPQIAEGLVRCRRSCLTTASRWATI